MASIRNEITVNRSAAHCWDALLDVGALHTRLVPGFVTGTKLEPGALIPTFGNGMVAKELVVDVCDDQLRVAWSVVAAAFQHHNASVQIFDEGPERARLVWIADFLPNELAVTIRGMIEQAMNVKKATLEHR
jgi:hypothetical protein